MMQFVAVALIFAACNPTKQTIQDTPSCKFEVAESHLPQEISRLLTSVPEKTTPRRAHCKYVAFAWENSGVTPAQLLKRAEELDKTSIDGVGVYLSARRPDGTALKTRTILLDPAWSFDDFAAQIPLFRQVTAHRSMKECFVNSFRSPTPGIEWEDDATWERIANNVSVAARVAREGGMRGLSMDLEDYSKNRPFFRKADQMPYSDLCALVRRRGREVFGRAFAEYPNATVFAFFLHSLAPYYIRNRPCDVAALVRNAEWLLPAFLDGMMDAMPPMARLVDGDEHSYRYESANNDYRAWAWFDRHALERLVAPENLEKFRRQVLHGFSLYMDMYVNDETSSWYKGPVDDSRVEHFRRDIMQAVETTDEYVWFWGERMCWTKWPEKRRMPDSRIANEPWESRLPGLDLAMRAARDPVSAFDFAKDSLVKSGELRNLVAEGGRFSVATGHVISVVKDLKGGEWVAFSVEAKGASASCNLVFRGDKPKPYVGDWFVPLYPVPGDPTRRVGKALVRLPTRTRRIHVVMVANNRPSETTEFGPIEMYVVKSGEDSQTQTKKERTDETVQNERK